MSHGGAFGGPEDPASRQQRQLNGYPPGSPHATAYTPGEGFDPLGFEGTDADVTVSGLLAAVGTLAVPIGTERSRYRMGSVVDHDRRWVEVRSLVPAGPP